MAARHASGTVRLLLRGDRGEQNAIGHLLDDAESEVGIVIARGENFALLGHANLRVVTAAGLGQDRLGRRAAAARDAAAAAVKKREPESALLADVGDGFLRLKERPVGGKVAAILVAVGVAEHDLLVVAAGAGGAPSTARNRTSG